MQDLVRQKMAPLGETHCTYKIPSSSEMLVYPSLSPVYVVKLCNDEKLLSVPVYVDLTYTDYKQQMNTFHIVNFFLFLRGNVQYVISNYIDIQKPFHIFHMKIF